MLDATLDANFDANQDFLNKWLSSRTVVVTLLSVLTFGLFFFADSHNFHIATTEAFVQDIEDQESWAGASNTQRRIAFLGCAAIGAMSLLLGRGQTFRMNLPIVLIVLYVLWAGASYTWSIDRSVTSKRYILMVCCVIACFGFSRFVEVKDVVLTTMIVTFAFLILGVAAEIGSGKFRPWQGSFRFAGTVHPNYQALNLAMGCIAAYTMTRIKPNLKSVFYGFFGVMLVFLVLTKCRSGTLTMPVAIGFIWFTSQPTKFIIAWLLAVFWMFSTFVLICLVTEFDPIAEYQEIILLGRGEETGESLTGRLPLWEDLYEYIGWKPWGGYGYEAFWNKRHISDIAESQQWTISEAHSSYIEATIQVGIIGAALMTAAAVSTLFYAAIIFRKTLRPEYLFLVGGVFLTLVRGFTEVGMSTPTGGFAFLILALTAHSWHTPTKLIDRNRSVDNDSNSP